MKHKRFTIEREKVKGWSRWVQPVMRGYLLRCCDCRLCHWLDFRIRNGRVQFRARRAPLYTARSRQRFCPVRIARENANDRR